MPITTHTSPEPHTAPTNPQLDPSQHPSQPKKLIQLPYAAALLRACWGSKKSCKVRNTARDVFAWVVSTGTSFRISNIRVWGCLLLGAGVVVPGSRSTCGMVSVAGLLLCVMGRPEVGVGAGAGDGGEVAGAGISAALG